jgi:regulator of protease activity HflC (stomatin/prohibitin superfamily)
MVNIKNATPKLGKFIALFILGIFALIVISNTFVSVQYGTVGVLTRFGQIVGEPMQPGLHFKIPFVDQVLCYKTQKIVYQTLYLGSGSANFASNTDYVSETHY